MSETTFEIHRTRAGFTAVHDPAERAILAILEGGAADEDALGRGLDPAVTADLPRMLAALQARELVSRDASGRYATITQIIGASYLPVPDLRRAVCDYIAISPIPNAIPLRVIWQALAASEAAPDHIAAQAHQLGVLVGQTWPTTDPRARWSFLLDTLLQQRIARHTTLDLARHRVTIVAHPGLPIPSDRLQLIITAFTDGLAHATQHDAPPAPAPHNGERLTFMIT